MKIIFKIVIFIFIAILLLPLASNAQEKTLNIYFFWGVGCPHCASEKLFLDEIIKDYPEVKIIDFEIWENPNNAALLQKISQKMDFNLNGIPLTIIGDQPIIGYLSKKTTGKQIEQAIQNCQTNTCLDPVADIINNQEPTQNNNGSENNNQEKFIIDLPLLGEIDAKKFSLPLLTIVIAALDGFNPCAMWVLLFLISLLLGMENKKRMWALGSAFILASGIIYFLFLTAWLNIFLFFSYIPLVQKIIGLVAIGSGVYYLREFYLNRPGCKLVKGDRRDKLFTNLKFITKLPSFWLALIGIVIIAFGVNLLELVCSAGLPAIYTNVLSLSNIPVWQYYLLLILYIIIFMLDDMLIFIIAMVTLQATGLTKKYTHYASLIGGILILIIGILLLLRPDLLMFG